MKLKESHYRLSILIVAVIIAIALFGFNALLKNEMVAVNLHDTYLTISAFHTLLDIICILFFVVYLIRAVGGLFKNRIVNITLIVSIVLVYILLGGFIQLMMRY